MASELESWYPLISEFTPESLCVDQFPPVDEVEQRFGWPVFIKGSRQTSRHSQDLSIVRDAHQYHEVSRKYWQDPILHWQKIAIRKFVDLEPVRGQVQGKVKAAMEFRTFWWHGECVGWGRYWYQLPHYEAPDIDKGLDIARIAASRLGVPFLVIDMARAANGQWLIIECNDAQESGYVGLDPYLLWQNILKRI